MKSLVVAVPWTSGLNSTDQNIMQQTSNRIVDNAAPNVGGCDDDDDHDGSGDTDAGVENYDSLVAVHAITRDVDYHPATLLVLPLLPHTEP